MKFLRSDLELAIMIWLHPLNWFCLFIALLVFVVNCAPMKRITPHEIASNSTVIRERRSLFVFGLNAIGLSYLTSAFAADEPETRATPAEVDTSDIIPNLLTAGLYSYDLAFKFMNSWATAEVVKDYAEIISSHILDTFKSDGALLAQLRCPGEYLLNLIDVTAIASRVITTTIDFIKHGTGDYDNDEAGVVNMLTEKTLTAIRSTFHQTECQEKTNQTVEEVRTDYMLKLIQKCYHVGKSSDAPNAKKVLTSTVSPSTTASPKKFKNDAKKFVVESIKTTDDIDVSSKNNNELMQQIVVSGSSYLYWAVQYSVSESENQNYKTKALLHHTLFFKALIHLVSKLSKKTAIASDEERIMKLIKPISSTTQVVASILEFISRSSDSNKSNAIAAIKILAKDYFQIYKAIVEDKLMKKPVTQSGTMPPLKSSNAPGNTLEAIVSNAIKSIENEPRAEL